MRQERFEEHNKSLWDSYNRIVKELDRPVRKRSFTVKTGGFPKLYRTVCHHYALSVSRQYSPALAAFLHDMVVAGHRHLYRRKHRLFSSALRFVTLEFPSAFRRRIRFFLAAAFFFLVPALTAGVSCHQSQDLVLSILGEQQVARVEAMYDPAGGHAPGRSEKRGSDTDLAMFGFYIKNNIGIGFRTFAGGILAGAGTLFFLIYNGVMLGGISGYLTRIGFGETFWPFVSGHGAFELTAIVISGAAGFMLAKGLIAPGRYRRGDALKKAAPDALKLVMGAACMLLMAAFVEAFWSSSAFPDAVKYSVAVLLWLLVPAYLALAGTGRRP
ncbi:MAG: stage II sporulation protein M [Desulfobacteraceae bacterium]